MQVHPVHMVTSPNRRVHARIRRVLTKTLAKRRHWRYYHAPCPVVGTTARAAPEAVAWPRTQLHTLFTDPSGALHVLGYHSSSIEADR